MATTVHYFVDRTATGSNDGSSPANAFTNLRFCNEAAQAASDRDVYIWVRRTHFEVQSTDTYAYAAVSSFSYNITTNHGGMFHTVMSRWPISTDRLYDIRPAAGISAGWDADGSSYPYFEGSGNTLDLYSTTARIEHHGLIWRPESGKVTSGGNFSYWSALALSGAGNSAFYDCTFDTSSSGDYQFVPLNSQGLQGGIEFENCTFSQITAATASHNTVGNCLLILETSINTANSMTFLNCSFSSYRSRPSSTDCKGGIFGVPGLTGLGRSHTSYKFVGCTFPGGHLYTDFDQFTGQAEAVPPVSYRSSPDNFQTVFIGCDMGGLQSATMRVREGQWNELRPNYTLGAIFINCTNIFSGGAYSGINYLDITKVRTVYHDGVASPSGSDTQVVIEPNSAVLPPSSSPTTQDLIAPTTGPASKYLFHTMMVWPDIYNMRGWVAQVPKYVGAGDKYRIKVNIKFSGWASLPTDTEFYLFTYNLTAVPPNPAANLVFSSQQPASNDTWTEYHLDLDPAPAVDTYVPIYCVFKTAESGATITIDPTTVVEAY